MIIKCVWEHNGDDSLLYSVDYVGAFTRGSNKDIAIKKMQEEITSYLKWKNEKVPETFTVEIIQDKPCNLKIADADSDVLFDEERKPLSIEEYLSLKEFVLKSAVDFYSLYLSVPDKNTSCMPFRTTFYGNVPRTAQEMYEHTKNVNAYYFGEIGIEAHNEGTIYECRKRGFDLLEQTSNFLSNPILGSSDELWSVRKMLRRFLWHDRIHAKAMYRMATRTFSKNDVKDTFGFEPATLTASLLR